MPRRQLNLEARGLFLQNVENFLNRVVAEGVSVKKNCPRATTFSERRDRKGPGEPIALPKHASWDRQGSFTWPCATSVH